MQRIDHKHSFRFFQGPHELLVILPGSHAGERSFRLVQAAGHVAVLLDAAPAEFGAGQLMALTLTKLPWPIPEKAYAVERTQALHRLKAQDVGIPSHRLRQERLNAPRIRDDHVI